jgi:hypothetical protein
MFSTRIYKSFMLNNEVMNVTIKRLINGGCQDLRRPASAIIPS